MTLWGGRFRDAPSRETWDFTADDSDRRLLPYDIEGSLAHAEMLAKVGILDQAEASQLLDGLSRIKEEAEAGTFQFVENDEDVHTAVERRLHELIGETAGKLHSGRSRNDQVALDLRLYLRQAGQSRVGQLHGLANQLTGLAESEADTVIPSYTHLQQAQATTLGHHLLAYAWMALRAAERFADAVARLNVSPLGAGASSGSSLPLDRDLIASHLGMGGAIPNSLDAVAARDFVAEYVFCCAQTMVDLSRLAEEIILWASQEFGWISLSDQISTGSSALPHKRNPDVAELIRGRTSVLIGNTAAILALQKALPLAYNRDLQEDKAIVFSSDDTLGAAIYAMAALLDGIAFHPPGPDARTVTLDLAEALVRKGVPFRQAHQAVGGLISTLEEQGKEVSETTLEDLTACHPAFTAEDLELLDPARSVGARSVKGSGSPESVREQVAEIRELLAADS